MKLLHVAILFLFSAIYSHAQGELFFSTRNPAAGVDAPIFIPGLNGLTGPGPGYSAGLFLNGSLVPTSLITFQPPGQGGAAILDPYVVPVTVQFAGSPVGTPVTFTVRMWDTAAGSYANASSGGQFIYGESGLLTVTLGGGTLPPADLPASFPGFAILDGPEPSTFALAFLGILTLGFSKRFTPPDFIQINTI
jgi:hypothetical protein